MLMLQNNLKAAGRNIWNNLSSSLLNILGLTLGVLCSIIIFTTIRYEFSFDKQHQNENEIYRVTNNYYYPTFTMYVGQTPDPMAEALKNDFPEFKSVFPIHSSYEHSISVGDQLFESDIIYCGAEFIQAFDHYNDPTLWIIGDPNQILKEINKTVLTESIAERIFGSNENAIGKIITLSNEAQIEVAGIIQDHPQNTNYPFDQLVSYRTYEQFAGNSFGGVSSTSTFVQIPPSIDVQSLKPALEKFNEKYMETAWGEDFVSMDLQPLSDIHFDERFGSNNYTTSQPYLLTLVLIGFFMIIIACINFINLATAKAMSRSKEIGMLKILGSSKKDIIFKYVSESFLLAFISIGLGILLSPWAFSYFSELTNLNIGNDFSYSPPIIFFSLSLLIFVTLAMSLYPATLMANFKPLNVIQPSKTQGIAKGLNLRRGLIAFQLTTAQILMIGAIAVTSQIYFFQNKDLGFSNESVLVVDFNGEDPEEKKATLKNKIKQLPFVKGATLASSIPMTGHHSSTAVTSIDSEIKERFNVEFWYADNDFADVVNLELLAGKTSVTNLDLDTVQGFVVNETLINRLAFASPEASIGKRINVHGYNSKIIGVVKDFHTLSLHEEIRPIAMVFGIRDYNNLGIKYSTTNLPSSIAQLETTWKTVFPNKNFDYYFQDEQMGDMYDIEIQFSQMIKTFTLICIIIACIGLIGLSAFSSVKRFKEIGVRKVLGASVISLLLLMSKEFILLTLLSFVISIPVAYYLISSWLQTFAYHIQIEWWMVLITLAATLILTLITVSLQSLRAALTNPVESLRDK